MDKTGTGSLDPAFSAKLSEEPGSHKNLNKPTKEVLFCVSCNTDLREKNHELHLHLGHETKLFPNYEEWKKWMKGKLDVEK